MRSDRNNTDLNLIPVWIQDAGCQERKVMLNDSDSYQASYGARQMQLTDRIPGNTTPLKPIILTKIAKPQSTLVNIY